MPGVGLGKCVGNRIAIPTHMRRIAIPLRLFTEMSAIPFIYIAHVPWYIKIYNYLKMLWNKFCR